MSGISTSDLLGAEKALRSLELQIGRKLDGTVHGDHASLLPGPGSEHNDARPYVPGDDVRRIDWNLTARTAELHVRDPLADRELETWFVVDGSASLDYGTALSEKRDLVLAVVAAFGFLTMRPGNRTGAVIFDGTATTILPPRAGRRALLAMVARLQRRPAAPQTEASLAGALRRARLLARRGALVVVVSDLLDSTDWSGELRRLGAGHDVVVAHVTDPREDDLPPVGLLMVVDPETGRRHEVQTSSRRFRERYATAARCRRDTNRDQLRRARVTTFEVATDRPWLPDVVGFVAARRRRR